MAKTEHLNSEQNIESIISAPLVALSKANMMMLSGQTTFLLKNCFKYKDGVYEPEMITMSIQVGGAEGKSMTFQMPLINLLSINALSVAKAHINFSIDITSSDSYPANGQTDILSEKALYRGRLNGTDRDGKTPERTGSVCGDLFAAPFARTAYRYGALREFRTSPENGNRIRRNKPLKTNNMPNAIPCPCCRNIIYFDLALLLKGEAFECSQCHSRISLTPQSRPIVAEASARLEELKQKASRQLDEKPEKQ